MEPRCEALILFGSQTGNGCDVAERVAREGKGRGVSSRVISMDNFNAGNLPNENIVLLIVSTTGQGEAPDKMKAFWRYLLRKNLGKNWLQRTSYAVFGLGDSGYSKYNVVAKKLDRRLADLGARPFVEKGLGDDQDPSGYETALDPWLDSLWKKLQEQFPGIVKDAATISSLDEPKLRVISETPTNGSSPDDNESGILLRARAVKMFETALALASGSSSKIGSENSEPVLNSWQPLIGKLVFNERLTAESHFQDVRHIEFDISHSSVKYNPGDIVHTLPRQPLAQIDKFFERTGFNPNSIVTVLPSSQQDCDAVTALRSFGTVTLRTLIESTIDVTSASPKRYFFEVLSHFCSDELEREKLKYFASAAGRDELYEYNKKERRTVLEILYDFPSAQLPLEYVLDVSPRLNPRAFSIASAFSAHPGKVQIAVAQVQWTTPYKRKKVGLCSSWLGGLKPGDSVPLWFSSGILSHPVVPLAVPLILIGPGTGCAPLRAFLEDRAKAAMDGHLQVSPSLLFFGCRNKYGDYLFKDQWESYTSENGVLSQQNGGGLFVAFSRDQPQKVYVQHKIRENGKLFWKYLNSECVVMVAGSASKMPGQVMEAMADIVMEHSGMGKEASVRWVQQLERIGRLKIECWS